MQFTEGIEAEQGNLSPEELRSFIDAELRRGVVLLADIMNGFGHMTEDQDAISPESFYGISFRLLQLNDRIASFYEYMEPQVKRSFVSRLRCAENVPGAV